METRRDRDAEGIFFALELKARRRRSDVSRAAQFASDIYGLTSDYGQSILKPQLYLGAVLFFFTIVYTIWLSPGGNLKDNVTMAAWASCSRVFPFGAFGDATEVYRDYINQVNGPISALWFMVVGTVESFMAITLAFLFGLAIRRRFQIN